MAIKVDMNKVFDRLEWSFLEKALLAFSFFREWVARIVACVNSILYQVNRSLNDVIVPSRGLCLGDPLSLYLFIIVMEVLSLISQDEGNGSTRVFRLLEMLQVSVMSSLQTMLNVSLM